jgi:Flp pilus assembly protein TadD
VIRPTMPVGALALTAVLFVSVPAVHGGEPAPHVAVESAGDARSESKAQVEFGIRMAQNGLWKEASYRWERATELDPTYPEAWNNLAIGYEHQGRFEDAEKAYLKALELAPKNVYIRQNYDLFKELNDRTKRRRDR